jgi:Do/DeqQ family serine protease
MTSASLSSSRRRLAIRLGLAVAAMAASAFAGMNLRGSAVHAGGTITAPAAPALPSVAGANPAVSYADLASRVSPSVVTVRSERVAKPASDEFSLPDDPFLRQFFGRGFHGVPSEPRRQGGLGSGVIVTQDGYVLTNHHVVDGAQRIDVDLADRRTLSAKVVGSDAASDLAVLKVEAKGLTPLPFGDSRSARVGDVVLAFGNPLGVGQTVTMGIISAKGRATDLGNGSFEDFLQTDAPINQGNSGGALVNLKGELIGINSQIVSPSGGSVGIGFAIPSAMAENVMNQLIHGGRVHRGQLGVTVQAVTSDIAKSLGMSEVKGALVSAVSPGSPADKAGLQRGDVILRLNGSEVADSNALRNQISSAAPGSRIDLTVLRDGRERTVAANLRELEDTKAAENVETGHAEGGKLGLSVRPLSPEEAKELGIEGHKGLVVAEVDPDGPGAQAGFQPGDVIQEVNGKPVFDVVSLRAAVESAGARPSLVLVARNGDSLFLTLQGRG